MSYSTSTPWGRLPSAGTWVVKNAHLSLILAACCMLWVTITIVYSCLSSASRSSMRPVAIGSRAEHGSSMRMTSGSHARARAMHSRCCWPPDSPVAESFSRSFTSSQSAAWRSDSSTLS